MALDVGGSAWAQDEPVTRAPETEVEGVTVTASTVDLIGRAAASSEGRILAQELQLRPVYRVGQLLETVPGLNVTAHSGEGKANQYLMRGFNLDHGHDLAIFVDGIPINLGTHGHGQGYSDLSFMIPELADGVAFAKGPYRAGEGDFSSVAAVRIAYRDRIAPQMSVSVGDLGYRRLFAAGDGDFAGGRLLVAAEASHVDGPWDHPDDYRKLNAVTRYSRGDGENGLSVAGMYYRGRWNATTDQPLRAMSLGLIGRYGSLDPSDGGQAERFSLSGELRRRSDAWSLEANAYVVRSQLTLWNNFTHWLDDPVHGDQHAQNDRRTYGGADLALTWRPRLWGLETSTTFGTSARLDAIYVDRRHTLARRDLETQSADEVRLEAIGAYVENSTAWTPALRTVLGMRLDRLAAHDRNFAGGVSGDGEASVVQPKFSLVYRPWSQTELYLSAGEGFHSNDIRQGAATARPDLLVRSGGEEIGLRTRAIPKVQLAATLFEIRFDSELTYDADSGETSPGRPSLRQGLELTAQYRPAPWLELNANLAMSKARYTDHDPAGSHVEDAPAFVGSLGVLVDGLGPWSGALEFRDLGQHALTEDNSRRSDGYREINLSLGYQLAALLKVELQVFNLTGSSDDAADYVYVDRLKGEPAAGVEDLHLHPLEPRSVRLTVLRTF